MKIVFESIDTRFATPFLRFTARTPCGVKYMTCEINTSPNLQYQIVINGRKMSRTFADQEDAKNHATQFLEKTFKEIQQQLSGEA